MRIVVDLQSIQGPSRFRGIGRYSFELIKALIAVAADDEVLIFLNNQLPEYINEIRYDFRTLLPQSNIKIFESLPGCTLQEGHPNRINAAEILREQFIIDLQPDVVLIPSILDTSSTRSCICSVGRLADKNFPVAVVLYDLIPLYDINRYLPTELDQISYRKRLEGLVKADLLLCISGFTELEYRRLFPGTYCDSTVIYGGATDIFALPTSEQSAVRTALRDAFGITKPYLFFTSGFDFHKNHEGLLRAFAKLPAAIRNKHQLVFSGAKNDGIEAHFKSIARQCSLPDDTLILTGQVKDSDLVHLYQNCQLFIMPSFYEGLGLPILEAIACGAPVIGSNTASIPELLPNDSLLFDPHNLHSISSVMASFLGDEERLLKAKESCLKHAEQFSWTNSALKTLCALRSAVNKHKTLQKKTLREDFPKSMQNIASLTLSAEEKRMTAFAQTTNEATLGKEWTLRCPRRTGWLTTWNMRCGIAAYSKNLTNFIVPKPIILAPKDVPITNDSECKVISCWSEKKKEAGLHEALEIINKLSLDEIMIQYSISFFYPEEFCFFVRALLEKGVSVFVTLHNTTDANIHSVIPVLRDVDGIFVHSFYDFLNLLKHGIKKNVKFLPLGVCLYENKNIAKTIDKKCNSISTYGFFLPHKGLLEMIEAVSLLHAENFPIHLKMINAVYSRELSEPFIRTCSTKIAELGLEHAVQLCTDFLEDSESISRLRETDLIVFPYQDTGESASAAVRSGLSTGKPVAVTPLKIFDDVKDVVFSLPGTDPQSLASGIKEILTQQATNSKKYVALQRRAEKWRSNHDYAKVAAYLNQEMSALSLTPHHLPAIDLHRQLFMDVSHIIAHDDRTGIQRVVRGILGSLLNKPPYGWKILPVYTRPGLPGYFHSLKYADSILENSTLSGEQDRPVVFHPGDIFFGLDWVPDMVEHYTPIHAAMRQQGVTVKFCMYDILPLTHPERFEEHIQFLFKQWFDYLVHHTDGVACISQTTANTVRDWVHDHYPECPNVFTVSAFSMGADIVNSAPSLGIPSDAPTVLQNLQRRPSFLQVGRLESRKRPTQTLAACEKLWGDGVDINLVFVGKLGWDMAGLATAIEKHPERNHRLFWLQDISDEYLQKIYIASSALIQASLTEGFGLPLIEAAQYKLPIIARNIPIFKEVAGEHAWYFSGESAEALAIALTQWLNAYSKKEHPKSDNLPWKSWDESADLLLNAFHIKRKFEQT
ncbi:MAG: glycosyltransferase [Cystobacterineae bacterium]|nr:glycosyltransferase [Cystobacterineae bacterium]